MNRSCVLTVAILASLIVVQAQAPPLPLVVKGNVKIDSSGAPIGTHIIARIGEDVLARGVIEEEGYYVLTIPGDATLESTEIQIYVNTIDSGETVIWEAGGIIDLDLNVEGEEIVDDPGDPDDVPEDVDDTPEVEPIDTPPDAGTTPDEPAPGEGFENPEEAGNVGDPEGIEGAQGEPGNQEAPGNTGVTGDGDNSIVFILFVVIIATFLVVGFILRKKRVGGTKK